MEKVSYVVVEIVLKQTLFVSLCVVRWRKRLDMKSLHGYNGKKRGREIVMPTDMHFLDRLRRHCLDHVLDKENDDLGTFNGGVESNVRRGSYGRVFVGELTEKILKGARG